MPYGSTSTIKQVVLHHEDTKSTKDFNWQGSTGKDRHGSENETTDGTKDTEDFLEGVARVLSSADSAD